MYLTGLDHVQIAMPEGGEEQARWFYGQVLGLQEVKKPAALARRGGCWFEAPGVIVHLGVQSEFTPARKAHPAFLVSNMEVLQTTLTEAGVEVIVDDSLAHVHRFYALDPFGNRIEFIQDGDGFSQQELV